MPVNISPRTKIFAAIGLQVVIILGIVGFKLWVLHEGTEVALQVQPVDPRDIFRGDYATFQYTDLTTLQDYRFSNSSISLGDTVYVPLQKTGTYWTAGYGVSKTPPPGDGVIYLRGKVTRISPPLWSGNSSPVIPCDQNSTDGCPTDTMYSPKSGRQITVTYGIEQYFIPEGAGQNVNFAGHEVYAIVKVAPGGNAVLERLYLDGKRWP